MLRPKYLQKNIVAFITLALVILYITVPTLAQRTNRKNNESSGSEQARQQQVEREKQQQAEQARQQAERERQQKAEQARQQAERERQQKAEQARQQAERERQQKAEQARQQAERERQQKAEQARQQAERERQQKAEQARQQAERERQQKAEQTRQQAERERQQRAEQEKQQQVERAKQQQAERERLQRAEQEKQQQAEREMQQRAEREKQQQAEREKRQRAEQEKQQQAERAKQQQAERERQRQAEREKQQQAEREKQQQAERARQQQSERINRKQLIISPNDRDLGMRTDGEMSERVNRKFLPLPNNTNTVVVDNSTLPASPIHRYELSRPSRLVYRDRPYATDTYRREYIYVDYSSRICTRTITPGYRFILGYDQGPWHTFRYFYPYYHRKYVFVSLGGYWPLNYRFIRYYWYGYHPYYWCGYYPIAREVVGSSYNYYTYNYYTYNYYYDDNPVSYRSASTVESQYYDNIYPQLAEEPADVTLADIYFEEAVRAFEEGNYGLAIDKFAKAMELAPDDMILPFAYSQALFAAQRYTEATEVLRSALAKITSDKEGVFYPRGLYPKDKVLLAQLDLLTEKAELYKYDADLQLLLGYQLLGLGQLDKAVTPLQNASLDLVNANAATILLGILEKIKTTEVQNEENVINYPESVITAPETEGVETETNPMSEIKFDDTQASAIGPNIICWSFSAGFALMSLVSILYSYKSRLN
jgi:hypothetical protein